MRLIPEVGDVVTVHSMCWTNAHGGTEIDHRGMFNARVRIVKAWRDYETGWRFWANTLEDVEAKDNLGNAETIKKGSLVFVDEFDVVPRKEKTGHRAGR